MDRDETGHAGRPRPWPHSVRWGPSSTPPKGHSPPKFLFISGWMDQDATRYGGRPQTRSHCGRWGPSSLSPKREHNPQIFSPCLLCPNGWMDQDATWYGGRLRPRPHCVRWIPSSPLKCAQPPIFDPCLLWPTAGWIKMPLDTKVDLGPDHIVLSGDPASPPHKGYSPFPNFRPVSIVAISATAEQLNTELMSC